MRFPWFRPSSLKTRVLLAVGLLFVAFAGTQTWLTLRHFDQSFRQNLYRDQFVLATVLADSIDDKLSQNRDLLVATAALVRPAMLTDARQAQGFLDRQAALLSIFDNGLLLISPQGQVIAESPAVRGLRGRSVANHDVFEGVSATGKPYLSRPFLSTRAQGRPVISIGVPLFDARGQPIGRLHGSLELLGRNFLADLKKIRIGDTGYVSLFTRDRLLIFHHDPQRIMQGTARPGENALLDRAIDGFEGSGTTVTSQGIAVLTSFKQLRVTPWILGVNLPMSEAEAPLHRARLYFFLAAAGGTLLVLGLVWLVMKRGLSPLEQLTRHVQELPLKQGAQRQLRLDDGGEIGTLVLAFNTMVDSLERQQSTLRESEARFRSLAEMSTDWYWEQDTNFRFTLMSQGLDKTQVTATTGKARWELPIVNVTPEQWDAHRAQLDRHEPFRDFVYQVRAVNGELRTFSVSGAPMFDARGAFTGYRGIGSDITERQAAEQRIEYLAYHDTLTGLPNRLLVQDRFEQAMAQAERARTRVALVYLDLDNFKTINDTLGHAAGDELLKEVARRLRESVRDTDTISRQGGDEFLLVLRDLPDTEMASAIVLKVMERLQEPFQLATHEVSSSASVGVAIGPDDGCDFETLRKKADMAMYRSKEAGRNAYHFFDATMDAEAGEHLLVRNGLRRALERHEFQLHYQPQYELASGRLIGVEALIRWLHPELGLVLPERFIAVAEESGLIVPIGDWVLRQACHQAMQWQRAGLAPITVSVNLSAIQFKRGNVQQSVTSALSAAGLDPNRLELELTESILIQNVESVLSSVRQLKQLGVKLAIDDFGTGYSSLSYLRRFDVDRLKIDQSFVRDIASNAEDAAIVRAIIQMAHSLKIKTIAEGVESGEMLGRLRVFGCDEAQGYHYARALPPEQIEQLLRDQGIDRE